MGENRAGKRPRADGGKRFDWRLLLTLLIIAAGLLAYASSFSGVFLFDDRYHVIGEHRLESLWPLSDALSRRRPVVDYTIAINYAIGGQAPWGYHAVNVGVHILAALTLFGIVRQTMRLDPLRRHWGSAAPWFALTIGLIWVTHPLLTQGVTYVIQRAESMMGLFYLLTLYCVLRGVESPRSVLWFVAAVIACAFGMGSKAVMVTAPVMVLIFDRVFLGSSLREILRRRWGLYIGLAATWSVWWLPGVAPSVLDSARRFSYVGFGYKGFTPLEYLQTQFGVLLYYLRLSLWPHPLCLDYHWPPVPSLGAAIPQMLPVLLLVTVTVWALFRNPRLGFLGLWFFVILAPTSSIVPIKDPIFEHRMYLSLAAVVVLVVLLVHYVLQQISMRFSLSDWTRRGIAGVLVVCAVGALTHATYERNTLYQDEVAMWRDVRAKQPDSARAAENLGTALVGAFEMQEAANVLKEAVRMNPRSTEAYNNLGFARIAIGQTDQAIDAFRESVRLNPTSTRARRNLGMALRDQGKIDEALEQFAATLRIDSQDHAARLELANTFLSQGRYAEAIEQYVYIVSEDPENASAWTNLGVAHLNRTQLSATQSGGQVDQKALEKAAEAFRAALRLNPNASNAQNSLGIVYAMRNETDRAVEAFRQALLLDPDLASAHYNLANCLAEIGDNEGALRHFVAATRVNPNNPTTHYEFGMFLLRQGQATEAIKAFRRTLELKPDHVPAHQALEAAIAREQDSSPD